MNKKRYFKPETEVAFIRMDTIILSSFDATIHTPGGTQSEDEIKTDGETHSEGDVPAPIFFPDLD